MARQTNIKLRRSATAGAIPTTSNLDLGELALNTYDGKLYLKTTEGSLDSVIQVGSATDSYFKIRKSQAITLTVTVASKTSDHIYTGQGSSLGYQINGIESPHINLVPGNTYRFDQSDSSNSGHPLRFYYDAGKTTAYTTGVTTNGTAGSSGAYTQIIATESTPPILFYQCTAHGYMGNRVQIGSRNLTGFDTDDLGEGSTNLYFTNARARAALSAGTGISYNSGTGAISSTITQYADSDARGAISVTDAGGDGSLAYNSSTGVITYTGPSAAEVRAHFSAGTGITISNGQISIGQAVGNSDNVTFNNGVFNDLAVNGTLTSDDITSTNISASGNLTVTGNLTVSGSTTTVNTATLDVQDKNITINFGSSDTSGTADGAGITIQDAVNSTTDATILWDQSDEEFDFSHGISFPDNQKITLGTGGDIEIFHDGNNSIIKDTGDGHVQVLSGTFTIGNAALSKTSAVFNSGGAQEFRHNNSIKLATTATGATVTGTLVADGVSVGDNENILLGDSGDLKLRHDGSDSYVEDVGAGSLLLRTDGLGIKLQAETGGTYYDAIQATAFGTTLHTQGAVKLTTTATGITVTGTVNVNSAYSLPTSDGTSGQALVTDGSGNLSFSTISAGGGGTVTEAFKNIAVSGQSNIVADSATDTLTFAAGSGIQLTTNASSDTLTITSTATGSVTEAFKTIAVSGQSNVVADAATDTLTLAAGSGMTITTTPGTDTITFASSGGGSASAADIKKTFVYTTSSSTTAFTGADDNSQTLSYVIGAVDVFLNGVKQQLTTDYAETNTSTITFVNSVASGNVVEIIAYYRSIGTNNSVVDQFTASGSAAFTLTSNPGNENNVLVYIDGVYQQKTDYTVSGTTLTMDTAPASGAIVECVTMRGVITDQQDLTLTGELDAVTLDISGNGDIDGNLLVGGNLHLDGNNQELRFYEGSNYVGFEAPALTGNQIWVLPDSDGTAGFALKTDGSGNLSWGLAGDNAFKTIAVSGQSDVVADSTADTLTLAAGTGIGITTTPGTDTITITNTQLGANAFGNIAVSGQTTVAADSTNDTLTLEAGAGITLTTDATNDKVTIAGGSGSVFTTDFFTASGSGSALLTYTLSTTPTSENELICFIEGVYQNKNSYTLSGTTLTFDSGIVGGQEIVVHHVGAGIVGVSPSVETFTGNGSATTYTLSVTPPNENYLQVYWDGVYQNHSEYTVSGTTLDFGSGNAPPNGTAIEVVIPSVNGIGVPSNATVTPAKLSTGGPSWDGNSNFIIGSHYQRSDSTSVSSTSATTVATHTAATYRSVKYTVQITQGSAYDYREISVIHDGTTAYMTEYGHIFTNSGLANFDATISSGNLLLQATMLNAASATIKVMSTAVTV